MKLKKFLNFNKNCPVCDSKLSLYLQSVPNLHDDIGILLKESNSLKFNFFLGKNNDYSEKDYILLEDNKLNYGSIKMRNYFNGTQFYFYYLCKEKGFRVSDNKDYEINLRHGCYYRSSPIFKIVDDKLKIYNIDENNLINHDEILSFSIPTEDNKEKNYLLTLDYFNKQTILMYYTIDQNQTYDDVDVMRQYLPELTKRPDFKNKNSLIKKFNSWIVLS